METKKPFERLPTNVGPIHYELYLKPDLQSLTFSGNETIKIEIKSATNKIVLHAAELDVTNASVTLSSGETVTPDVSLSPDDELLTLSFIKELPPGQASLTCSFVGELNDKLKGFYRSKCIDPVSRKETYAAVTQFCAIDARKCFPCWDEPAVKAQFTVTLCVQDDKVALSNMPVIEESHDGEGNKILKFETTHVMSTYLVAIVVGDFDYVQDKTSNGVLVRVYTPVGRKNQGETALNFASKMLQYYEEYFKISYPLPKLDLIAIADFAYGAMENWGLITFRETRLLVDPANTSSWTRQAVAKCVGHELAHQWFGNLVTMEWWTHLWLNEGYASFTENLSVARLHPEFDIWTQFLHHHHNSALRLDALNNSHPIEVPIGHPSEIDEIFDRISYSKGASVIRMLHRYIGDDDFRKGMNLYLVRHAYKNASTEDLWAALEESSGKPLKEMMTTWTKQMGFPLLTIESSRQLDDSRELVISQAKFGGDGKATECNSLWLVPLSFCKSSSPQEACFATVLKERRATIIVPNVKPDEWLKLNCGTYGFYRTQYPGDLLLQFIPDIKRKTLAPLDRTGLLDDLFALVQCGNASTTTLMELMLGMEDEDNYVVWATINYCLSELAIILSDTALEEPFHKFGRRLMETIYKKVGWDPQPNESHLKTLLRSMVIDRLGQFGHDGVIAEAKKRFENHICKKEALTADLRAAVYKAVLSTNEKDIFETMLQLYKQEDLHEEKQRISNSLGVVKDAQLLMRVLEFAISDDVRAQSAVSMIVSVGLTAQGRELAWNFIKNNWQTFKNMYKDGILLISLVGQSTENFTSEEKAKDVENFFKQNPWPGVERTVRQSIESIRNHAAWLERDRDSIKDFLSKI
nr:PREDICTED: puromycin-sensitive aminopeptidase-like [Bemisia tabaci]XP_018910165.1 PREDICTED: puromycin-sensitive aminopeptidase-like [Bemisia tabaci]XP_018910174.1 PREDICTED: puromycin-sensitive aminopeptidase-like [Bemisia tabaci]